VRAQGGNVVDKIWLNDVAIHEPGKLPSSSIGARKARSTPPNPGGYVIKARGSTDW
jgi:hypothetical protein